MKCLLCYGGYYPINGVHISINFFHIYNRKINNKLLYTPITHLFSKMYNELNNLQVTY